MNLEYSGIALRQFTHSAEIKREIPFYSFGFARVTEVRHMYKTAQRNVSSMKCYM